jgi:CcmE
MKIQRVRSFWAAALSILYVLIIATTVNAQAIKIKVSDILSNPDQYDGKMVQVEGDVTMLKAKVSKKGNPYYTFKLADREKSLSVFNFGTPSVKEGNSVMVMGRYQKVKHVGRYTFYNEVDASGGSVQKL